MKANIHPQYFDNANVVCACGATYSFGSTKDTIHVELCAACHPFYTGAQRFVDTANKIDSFNKKRDTAVKFKATVSKQKEEKAAKNAGPKSLAEMLSNFK
jgi:large subunit ribosomal protein L31